MFLLNLFVAIRPRRNQQRYSTVSFYEIVMTTAPWWIDFVAGWCSGATSLLICQPLDTILTRQQAHLVPLSHPPSIAASSSSTATATHWISLWRGVSPMIGAVPLQNALLMSGYGLGKRWSEEYSSTSSPTTLLWAVFIGGCTGGILQSFLMSPIELIKVTQQVYRQNMSTAFMTLQQNHHASTSGGWRSSPVWKGLHATLWRDGIPHGVWFVSYEFLKNTLDEKYSSSPDSINVYYHSMLSGAFAATCAWLVGYPFDIIKTRIQANSKKTDPQGMFQTAQILIQESGGRPIQALYRGFGLKLLRAIPASAIGFSMYEWVKTRISS